jgi:hypothetical protein
MLTKIITSILIILLGLSSCTQGTPVNSTPTDSSGIEGHVTMGPTCPGPVRLGSTECQDLPYQANISVLDSKYSQITHFQTDNNGYFKISLEPGTYILHPESGNPLPIAADQIVVVTDGQFNQVSIVYDTGIR